MLIWLNSPKAVYRKFLLLDRDGVINENRPDYVKDIHEYRFYPDALEALSLLNKNNIGVVLISNQSGINRGLISWNDFWEMHDGMLRGVEESGGNIQAAFYCPHRPDENCTCRKTSPEMILTACRFFGIVPAETSFIGDHETDIEAAARAGCGGIRICRNGGDPGTDTCNSGEVAYASLLEAVLDLYKGGI
jgi:D-glycero-D-manno-heptose 1,7-bisphosphate phosphatase